MLTEIQYRISAVQQRLKRRGQRGAGIAFGKLNRLVTCRDRVKNGNNNRFCCRGQATRADQLLGKGDVVRVQLVLPGLCFLFRPLGGFRFQTRVFRLKRFDFLFSHGAVLLLRVGIVFTEVRFRLPGVAVSLFAQGVNLP